MDGNGCRVTSLFLSGLILMGCSESRPDAAVVFECVQKFESHRGEYGRDCRDWGEELSIRENGYKSTSDGYIFEVLLEKKALERIPSDSSYGYDCKTIEIYAGIKYEMKYEVKLSKWSDGWKCDRVDREMQKM